MALQPTAVSALSWLGHATVLLDLGGTRLLTDPVLRGRVAHLRRHGPAPAAPPSLDAVLLSHLHRDHLDLPSLRRLDEPALLVTGPGGARVLRGLRREVVELAPGEEVTIGGVRVLAVPAVHDGRRSPFAGPAEAVGFVVEGAHRIYFAGDTECFEGMADLAPLDVALVPIWGWGPSLGAGHMDPEEAARATRLLSPLTVVPVHWGTFLPAGTAGRYGHLLRDPPHAFAARVAELAPRTRVEVLQPGGTLAFTGR